MTESCMLKDGLLESDMLTDKNILFLFSLTELTFQTFWSAKAGSEFYGDSPCSSIYQKVCKQDLLIAETMSGGNLIPSNPMSSIS